MLRVAIPNKGQLSEPALQVLLEAGYRGRSGRHELYLLDPVHSIEFFFLRPRDIAHYVASGSLDLGISGRDLVLDSGAAVDEVLPLNFGHSRLCYAVQQDRQLSIDDLANLRVATSFPRIVQDDFAKRGLPVQVLQLEGAVETAIQLGVADAIADVVQTGSTLRQNGLTVIGEPILSSEAILIARDQGVFDDGAAQTFLRRIRGVVMAKTYVMMEYDIPNELVDDACQMTPGIESPTIAPLHREGWFAIKAMVPHGDVNRVMDELHDLGARGILVTEIRASRL